ncbi:hypothetical protein [Nocardia beijingensis]|uniref:Uncharacterized protein n=1 Tax=Nocardia beijingensis TaxID=95162 RepID=A0ABW7WJ08_9NOCA
MEISHVEQRGLRDNGRAADPTAGCVGHRGDRFIYTYANGWQDEMLPRYRDAGPTHPLYVAPELAESTLFE